MIDHGMKCLMEAQIRSEMELAHSELIHRVPVYRLLLALDGIRSCGTDSKCAQMHAAIAREAVLRFEIATGISVSDALSWQESESR